MALGVNQKQFAPKLIQNQVTGAAILITTLGFDQLSNPANYITNTLPPGIFLLNAPPKGRGLWEVESEGNIYDEELNVNGDDVNWTVAERIVIRINLIANSASAEYMSWLARDLNIMNKTYSIKGQINKLLDNSETNPNTVNCMLIYPNFNVVGLTNGRIFKGSQIQSLIDNKIDNMSWRVGFKETIAVPFANSIINSLRG